MRTYERLSISSFDSVLSRRLLRTDPNSIVALNGLQELEEPPDELPMINAALVAETLKP